MRVKFISVEQGLCVRVMQTRFSESRKTGREYEKASISVFRGNEKRANKSKVLVLRIEENPNHRENDRLAGTIEKCLLCDPDWCPTYKRRSCNGKKL